MEELRSMLEQVIMFYEKYDEIITPFGTETIREFWTIEEMNSSFVLDDVRYVVYQSWHRNIFNSHHTLIIYKDNIETDLDIFFIRTLLANLNREMKTI